MAKTFPVIGTFVADHDDPAPLKVLKVSVGVAAGNDVVVGATGVYPVFTPPAGVIIHAVLSRVVTAWTAALTATLGDVASAAGFLASADIAPQTAVATGILVSSVAAGEAYAGGKLYLTPQVINLTVAGAAAVVGQQDLYFLYSVAGEN